MPAPAFPASTLILARDSSGLEVYMTRRSPGLDFLAGYHVFPGGRRDEQDFSSASLGRMAAAALEAKAKEIDSQESDAEKLGYYAAAIREAFEEAGVLIACGKNGGNIAFDADLKAELGRLRGLIHQGRMAFLKILEQFDFYYDLDRVIWFAHWVTPEWSPKRFDTQFFTAKLPEGQSPKGFPEEVDKELWLTPGQALAKCELGELMMIPPTIASLEQLSRFKNLAELFSS